MSNMITIKIDQPVNDRMGASFAILMSVISQLNKVQEGDEVIIDLTTVSFVYPILILPLTLLIREAKLKGCKITISNSICSDYLNTITFPKGWNPKHLDNWQELLAKYNVKSYIPILAIPSYEAEVNYREETLTLLGNILKKQIGLKGQLFTAFSYMLSEAFDNIVEHARIENGWIMVQNYPKKNFLDICIVDSGEGILKSYKNNKYSSIISHEQALNEAINGLSTKNYEGNRGYGIRTSRHMLVNGLGGSYFMFSGNAFYIWNKEIEQITALDVQYNWNGTMVALRIPKVVSEDFNFYNYIEK